jgi:hypothetical protein
MLLFKISAGCVTSFGEFCPKKDTVEFNFNDVDLLENVVRKY